MGREAAMPPAGILRKVFGRNLMDMAVLLMVTVVFSGLRQPTHVLGDPDIWWHLADARAVVQTHQFIHADTYSFTVHGEHWVNPEWLSEMPFWLGYSSFGLVGIYLVTGFLVSWNVLFLYWRSYFKSRSAGVALWMAALGFVLMVVNANSRTILVAYIALGIELAILDAVEKGGSGWRWALPPLFCIWINLHGSWIIGLALLVVYIACGFFKCSKGIFEQTAFSPALRKQLLYVLGASIVVLLINPYGWRLVWNPFDMALNQSLNIANVQEWQPLNLGWFVGRAALLAIVLMVIANAFHGRKWKVYEMIFVIFAWFSAFDHARFTFLAAMLTIPMLAADLARAFPGEPNPKTIPVMNAVMALGALGVISYYIPTNAKMEKAMAEDWPMQTIASIQPNWRTLNQDQLGGVFDFYGKPSFIDTRWDIFEHHGVMKDFIDILRVKNSLELLDKYQIDHVLVRQEAPLAYLLGRTPGWSLVRREGKEHNEYAFFARNDPSSAK